MVSNVSIKQEPKNERSSTPSGSSMNGIKDSRKDDSAADVIMDDDDLDDEYEDSLDLDTSKADTKVWLVRLPKFLMEKWRDPSKLQGQELGKVRIHTQSAGSSGQQSEVGVLIL